MNFKVALIQAQFAFDDLEGNLKKAEKKIREAAAMGANYICLPESFNRGYSLENIATMLERAEREDGQTLQKMTALARELSVILIAPLFIRGDDGKVRNSAYLISEEGKIIGSYSKSHPIGGESSMITSGDQYPVFDTKYCKVGILICNVICFGEAARIMGIQGVDLIFVPAAWRFFERSFHWWTCMAQSRALDNMAVVAEVNQIGPSDGLQFAGESKFIMSDGRIGQHSRVAMEQILIQDISLDEIREWKSTYAWRFTDRKPEEYKLLCQKI
jgi:predicted amidohydrolase